DGELVSQAAGTGNTPKSARIKLVQQIDRSEPAILVGSKRLAEQAESNYSLQ
ncbi:hypothetical protein FRC11_004671, partial [Ceratobasidium sp. 423]